MLLFIQRLFLAIFNPTLKRNIEIAIKVVNLIKYTIRKNGPLDELAEKTKTNIDNEVLFWVRKAINTLSGWFTLLDIKDFPLNDNERAIVAHFNTLPKDVQAAFLLRLAVHTVGQLQLAKGNNFDSQEKYLILVQAQYLRDKSREQAEKA